MSAADTAPVNAVHRPCAECGATLHAPGFKFDGPVGPAPGRDLGRASFGPTYLHTPQRCEQLKKWRRSS